MSDLIVAFSPAHFARVRRAFERAPDGNKPSILALDLELEWLLADAGIPFTSGDGFREHDSDEPFVVAEKWVGELLRSEPWRSYTYDEVPMLTPFAYSLTFYLMQVGVYGSLLRRAFEAMRPTRVLVCAEPSQASAEGIVLTRDPGGAFLRAARHVAGEDVAVDLLSDTPARIRNLRLKQTVFTCQRALFGFLISLYNAAVSLVPRKQLKLLASENWFTLADTVAALPEAELVLLDRAQIRSIPPSALLAHRIRFKHADAYVSAEGPANARAAAAQLEEHWQKDRSELPALSFEGVDARPLAHEMLDTIFAVGMPRATLLVEESRAMLAAESPNLVLLRASVSAQLHFPILGLVATSLGIPSLEEQHGLEYLGPGSISKEHTAGHIAVYGAQVAKELEAIGFAAERAHVVGSPRFDAYRTRTLQPRPKSEEKIYTIVAPDTIMPGFGSYEIAEYYRAAAQAIKRVPGASAIIKLRPGPERDTFQQRVIAEAFANVPYRIAQYESIADVLAESDVLISYYSTVILEAMQLGRSVVLAATCPSQANALREHFGPYAAAGAVRIASAAELGETLSALADERQAETQAAAAEVYLDEHYAFDGHAAARMRALVLALASGQNG